MDKAFNDGIQEECKRWENKPTEPTADTPKPSTSDTPTPAIQLPFNAHDVSTQTVTSPPMTQGLPLLPDTESLSAPLDWAEDVASIPILPNPSIAPRDLSVLRTPNSQPFRDLRRHRKRRQMAQHTWSAVPQKSEQLVNSVNALPPSFITRRHPSGIAPGKPVIVIPSASASSASTSPLIIPLTLDWDQDPRLLELGCALKALGWIRAL